MPNVTLPKNYKPTKKEKYMNPQMLAYFKQKLKNLREEVLKGSGETISHLQEEGGLLEPDIIDRASLESDTSLELKNRDRDRKLLVKIDNALERIKSGTYGYCEETGDPIGIERLEARPFTTLSIEAQERYERMKRTHREE